MRTIGEFSFIAWCYLLTFLAVIACMMIISCGSYNQTESYSVVTNIELPKGMKLVNPIWNGDRLWYLLEPMDSEYIPKNKVLQERSSPGILSSKIVFKESR